MTTLGIRIMRLRKERKWTQAKLSKEIGVSASTITMWESDSRDPSTKAVVALARLFGVSTDYLLGKQTRKPDPMDVEPEAPVVSYKLRLIVDYEPATSTINVLHNDFHTTFERLGILDTIHQMCARNLTRL